MPDPTTYTRLAKHVGFILSSSLWDGGDHLLCISTSTFSERYSRIAYADIRLVEMRETTTYTSLNILFGCLTAIPVLLIIVLRHSTLGAVFGLGLLAGLLILLGLNILRGPTCEVRLTTAVQVKTLAALRRISRATPALERIRYRCLAAQGDMPSVPDVLAAGGQELAALSAKLRPRPVAAVRRETAPTPPTGAFVRARGALHAGGLVLAAAILGLAVHRHLAVLAVIGAVAGLLLAAGVPICVIQQRRRWGAPALRAVTLASTGILLIGTCAALGLTGSLVAAYNQVSQTSVAAGLDPGAGARFARQIWGTETVGLTAALVALAAVFLILSAIGIRCAAAEWGGAEESAPAPEAAAAPPDAAPPEADLAEGADRP